MNSKKKYVLAKNIQMQDGGYIPFRIVQFIPNLVIGSPLTGLKSVPIIPPGFHPNVSQIDAQVKIISDRYNIQFSTPHKIVPQIADSLQRHALMSNQGKNEEKVKHIIATPFFQRSFYVSYSSLLDALKRLDIKYKFNNLTNLTGLITPSKENNTKFSRVIKRIEDEIKKEFSGTNGTYSPINFPQ